jgi:GDP-L-fucose synthase
MGFYTGKKVLVTGGTGLIGRPLVKMLIEQGADVTVASLDDAPVPPIGSRFIQADLRYFDSCQEICEDMDIVFQLAGIKGSPVATSKQPASFFVPTLQFSTNMMEAARLSGVGWYLNTSSVGVYGPAEVFHEDAVWDDKPSTHDKFAGWAKRIGEMQAEAYKIEYGWDRVSIVRPANVYGPFDSFSDNSAMVIPSLIKRVVNGEYPLKAWGDGSPIRDFIHARDCARGMMIMVENGVTEPVNLGSGVGVSIKELAETIAGVMNVPVEWDTTKPNGDAKRLMDTKRAESYGFKPEISLVDGIIETIDWYKANIGYSGRYSSFDEHKEVC